LPLNGKALLKVPIHSVVEVKGQRLSELNCD